MEEELPPPFQTSAWALLVWGLANSGPNAHRADRGFGHALAESRFSEHRLERLLAADHPTILTLAAAAVRFLATKGEAFDWVQLARLLLVRDDALLEATQRSIATDYYRHLPRIPDKE
jgi:CRISPR system Cascade subunit CasB